MFMPMKLLYTAKKKFKNSQAPFKSRCLYILYNYYSTLDSKYYHSVCSRQTNMKEC